MSRHRPEEPRSYIQSRVVTNDRRCWIWQGPLRNEWGYGEANVAGVRALAHRVAYEAFVGAIPDGILVLHRCDTPLCCNPEHLFLGTHADNTHDAFARRRRSGRRGESNNAAKLTPEQVREIRSLGGGESISALARQFGVSRRAVRFVLERKTWPHI